MKVRAFAKINLCLDVLRRKDNGYHEVEMVMTNVDIFDVLEIKELEEKKILLKSYNTDLAMDETFGVEVCWRRISRWKQAWQGEVQMLRLH